MWLRTRGVFSFHHGLHAEQPEVGSFGPQRPLSGGEPGLQLDGFGL